MKVLYISHACVLEVNRKVLGVLARNYGTDLHLVTHKLFRLPNGTKVACEPHTDKSYVMHEVDAIGGQSRTWFYPKLLSLVKRVAPSVIHVDNEPGSMVVLQAILLAKLFGSRIVITTLDNLYRNNLVVAWNNARAVHVKQTLAYLGLHVLQRLVLSRLDGLVTVIEETKEIFQRGYGYRGLCWVIPIGIDTALFRPIDASDVRKKLGLTKFTIGYFGRLLPEKGVETLLQAQALLNRDVQLLIDIFDTYRVDGYQERLLEFARQLGIADRIVLFDAKHLEMPYYYNAAHCAVVPSRTMPRWKEQYGRVIAEAMSCGIPVIGSDSGSIPAMIGADGLLFPEGNVQALANQLRELIDNPDLRAELARRGLERAKSHYSIEVQAREMSIAYRQLTAISNPQVSPS